jgi:hypothetical protein
LFEILSSELDGFSFALFKLVKAVSYVPAGVDVMVNPKKKEKR